MAKWNTELKILLALSSKNSDLTFLSSVKLADSKITSSVVALYETKSYSLFRILKDN